MINRFTIVLQKTAFPRERPSTYFVTVPKRLPDVATLSRMLEDADEKSVERLRRLLRRLVVDRLRELALSRVTLDFDGSVQSTTRHAEGTAVGYNKKKKVARSYYPHLLHDRPDVAGPGLSSLQWQRARFARRPGVYH